jgi:hypothetical protein
VNEPALWMMSINAFGAVLGLLSLLAGAVWLLTVVFSPPAPLPAAAAIAGPSDAPPDASRLQDAPIVAAIQATVRQLLPGGVVSRIEEVR